MYVTAQQFNSCRSSFCECTIIYKYVPPTHDAHLHLIDLETEQRQRLILHSVWLLNVPFFSDYGKFCASYQVQHFHLGESELAVTERLL